MRKNYFRISDADKKRKFGAYFDQQTPEGVWVPDSFVLGEEDLCPQEGDDEISESKESKPAGSAAPVPTTAVNQYSRASQDDPGPPITLQEIEALVPENTSGMRRVFPPEQILLADELLSGIRKSDQKRLRILLRKACQHGGWRTLPWVKAKGAFPKLRSGFGNFDAVLRHLARQWGFARYARDPSTVCIAPMLLAGPPGIGKTFFAREFAQALGVQFRIFSAAIAQDAFQFTGTDAGWANTKTGMVFDLLAHHDSAVAVVVVDEIDKIYAHSSSNRDTPINALLDLAEGDSAALFRDICVQMQFDASRIILICTANETKYIPTPLMSRLTRFDILPPTPEQKRALVIEHFNELKRSCRSSRGMRLAIENLDQFLFTDGGDIRALRRKVMDAFQAALEGGERLVDLKAEAEPQIPPERLCSPSWMN